MTIIQDTVTARNPRELISKELFGKLVARVQDDYAHVAPFYAELMVEQMLGFLATSAEYDPDNPPAEIVTDDGWNKLTPSEYIDPALHAFLDFTREYREFCKEVTGGRFLDHVPVMNDSIESGRSIAITVRAMRHYGWPVDERMWTIGASCCSGCVVRISDL